MHLYRLLYQKMTSVFQVACELWSKLKKITIAPRLPYLTTYVRICKYKDFKSVHELINKGEKSRSRIVLESESDRIVRWLKIPTPILMLKKY